MARRRLAVDFPNVHAWIGQPALLLRDEDERNLGLGLGGRRGAAAAGNDKVAPATAADEPRLGAGGDVVAELEVGGAGRLGVPDAGPLEVQRGVEDLVEEDGGRAAGAAPFVDGGGGRLLEANVGGVDNGEGGHLDGDEDGGGLAVGGGAVAVGNGQAPVGRLPAVQRRGEPGDDGVGGEAGEALVPGGALEERSGDLAEERGALDVVRLQALLEVFGERGGHGARVAGQVGGGEGFRDGGADEVGDFGVELPVVQLEIHGLGGAAAGFRGAGAAHAVEEARGLLGEDGERAGGRGARGGGKELRVEQLAIVEAEGAAAGGGDVEAREEGAVLEDVLDVDADGERDGHAERLGEVVRLVGVGGVGDFDLGKHVVEVKLGGKGEAQRDGRLGGHGVEVEEAGVGRLGQLDVVGALDRGVGGEEAQAAGAGLDAHFAALERVPAGADGEVEAVVLVEGCVLGGGEVDVESLGVLVERKLWLSEDRGGGRLRVDVGVVVEEDAAGVQAKVVDFVFARNNRLSGQWLFGCSGGQLTFVYTDSLFLPGFSTTLPLFSKVRSLIGPSSTPETLS